MDTHTDPRFTETSPEQTLDEYIAEHGTAAGFIGRTSRFGIMPEWRRRSLAAADSPFAAVADMTDRVAGR